MFESDVETVEVPAVLASSTEDVVEGTQFLMPRSMTSPGVLHIIDTVLASMHTALPSYEEWLASFKALAKLLSTKHLRQRFVQTCCVGRHAHFKQLFKRRVQPVAPWRWSTILLVLQRLLPLQKPLRATWCAKSFLLLHKELMQEDQDHLDVEAITTAIQTPMFWAYGSMLLQLHSWGDNISKWAETCPCHQFLQRRERTAAQPWQEKVLSSLDQHHDGCKYKCRMAGKRAPELASGALQEHMQALTSFHGMQVLPWKLCGMAHPSAAIARAVATACIDEFDWSACKTCLGTPKEQALHHSVTWAWLSIGSSLRSQVERFIAGEDLATMPELATS
eukprot:6492516-Amphidinium_carterae.2